MLIFTGLLWLADIFGSISYECWVMQYASVYFFWFCANVSTKCTQSDCLTTSLRTKTYKVIECPLDKLFMSVYYTYLQHAVFWSGQLWQKVGLHRRLGICSFLRWLKYSHQKAPPASRQLVFSAKNYKVRNAMIYPFIRVPKVHFT